MSSKKIEITDKPIFYIKQNGSEKQALDVTGMTSQLALVKIIRTVAQSPSLQHHLSHVYDGWQRTQFSQHLLDHRRSRCPLETVLAVFCFDKVFCNNFFDIVWYRKLVFNSQFFKIFIQLNFIFIP